MSAVSCLWHRGDFFIDLAHAWDKEGVFVYVKILYYFTLKLQKMIERNWEREGSFSCAGYILPYLSRGNFLYRDSEQGLVEAGLQEREAASAWQPVSTTECHRLC